MKKNLIITIVLILSIVLVSLPSFVHANGPQAITRVQGNARGILTLGSLSVTLSNTPSSGNVLVAVIGAKGTSPSVGSISQTGVTWYNIFSTSMTGYDIEVWAGIVDSASASKTTTISLTGTITSAVADVCEYSGLNTAYIISHPQGDQTASKTKTSPTTTTDTTATDPTTYANELWVGGAILNTYAQSSPTHGFTLLDGAISTGISLSYLENIVSSTGNAESGTTAVGGSGVWVAILVTLPATPSITLTPNYGGPGATITLTGYGFAVDSPMTATFDGSPLTLIGTTTTDSTGYFTCTFQVPSETNGGYTVIATDNQGASADNSLNPFTVTPESPVGVISSVFACAAALAVWTIATKRKKIN
ncbi:MAG: hypothetical protein ABR909_07385 [Candidatus Bathyarchaeia archaeon]|jgi:hypothetical protein